MIDYPDLRVVEQPIPSDDPNAYIPTYGHVAAAINVYRTVGIIGVRNRPRSWCYTDTDAASALGRLVDGPIQSADDLGKAEAALRAILLHDFVDIVVPCVKTLDHSGNGRYCRFDKSIRSDASYDAINSAPCEDILLAVELVKIKHGEIVESTNLNSRLIGRSINDDQENYSDLTAASADIVNSLPITLNAAAYFSEPRYLQRLSGNPISFIDSLYKRIYKPWMEVAQSQPTLFIDLKLPPLMSIILSRAAWRKDIPTILRELREELAEVRSDLNSLNERLDSVTSQADIYAHVQRINKAFDAIVPEALLTPAERRLRRVISVFRFLKPIPQLYTIASDPLAAGPEKYLELFGSTYKDILSNPSIVARSVTAAKFAELMRVDSLRDMITTHFNEYEIAILQRR